jgi:hypothetical protein
LDVVCSFRKFKIDSILLPLPEIKIPRLIKRS